MSNANLAHCQPCVITINSVWLIGLDRNISHRKTLLPPLEKLVSSYIEKLLKGKRKARFVICGSFGLHMHDSFLEDLLVANVGLDQSPETRDNSLCLFVKLENRKIDKNKQTKKTWVQFSFTREEHWEVCQNNIVSNRVSLCYLSGVCSSWRQDTDMGVCRCKLPCHSPAGSKHR